MAAAVVQMMPGPTALEVVVGVPVCESPPPTTTMDPIGSTQSLAAAATTAPVALSHTAEQPPAALNDNVAPQMPVVTPPAPTASSAFATATVAAALARRVKVPLTTRL